MARADPKTTRRPFATALKVAIYVALVGLLALIVAVAVAYANLPSYSDLSKRSDLGQMIRVRAANGAVLVNIGPSFGQWLSVRPDPAGDARGDDRRRGQALPLSSRRRSDRRRARREGARRHRPLGAGRVDHHPAARAQHLPDQQPHVRPQGQGSDPRAGDRAEILEEPDPRALSQPRLFRRRRLWHRRRVATFLRPQRTTLSPRRSGDHRRPGQGPVQLFADRRRRGRPRPLAGRAATRWSRTASSRRRPRGAGRSGRDQDPAGDQAEQRPLLHRLGAAAARHSDRRDQRADRRLDDARSRHAGAADRAISGQHARRRAGRAGRASTATERCGR